MPTFLVTAKMDPALAARVEKAVTGGRATSPRTIRRVIAVARIALVLSVILGVRAFVVNQRREHDDMARMKTELVEEVSRKAGELGQSDRDAVGRAMSWIVRLTGDGFEEVVADEVRGPGAMTRRLGAPILWVRGPIDGFGVTRLAETARASGKDALVYCLLDPPPLRTEKAVLEKVSAARLANVVDDAKDANVARLHEAIVGLPFLAPAWREEVGVAPAREDVLRLRREWEHARVDRALAAAQARVLVVVFDEAGERSAVTELDGERPHVVRVAVVDMAASKVLLATRRHVDPSWISKDRRPTHAMDLDSCALAFDVHEALAKR